MVEAARYWDAVYASKSSTDLSWYQARPTTSLRLIKEYSAAEDSVLDIGAGTSTLVDALLDEGREVTLLDASSESLRVVRRRLDTLASNVTLLAEDLTSWTPAETYGVWHDRAVFHFLVEPASRACYVVAAEKALAEGGVAVIATFAEDGPTECSGLPTARYTPDQLASEFGTAFTIEHAEREEHTTPWGGIQPFTWAVLRHGTGGR